MRRKERAGFTVVEMLTVVAMLMLLAGALTSAMSAASRRSRIAQATVDVQEITNAILGYEAYRDESGNGESRLSRYATGAWSDFTEADFGFLLGAEQGVPVLYNAELRGGRALDPWGNPYRIMIAKENVQGAGAAGGITMYLTHPNANRVRK